MKVTFTDVEQVFVFLSTDLQELSTVQVCIMSMSEALTELFSSFKSPENLPDSSLLSDLKKHSPELQST